MQYTYIMIYIVSHFESNKRCNQNWSVECVGDDLPTCTANPYFKKWDQFVGTNVPLCWILLIFYVVVSIFFEPDPWGDDSQFDEHVFDSRVATPPTTDLFGGCLWPVLVPVKWRFLKSRNHQLVPSRKLTYPTKQERRKNIDSKEPWLVGKRFQIKYFGTKDICPSWNQQLAPKTRPSQALSCERYSKLLQILSLDNLDFDTAELGISDSLGGFA